MADNANIADGSEVDEPLCATCLRPVSPLDHYCPHCGQSVGQLTAYLPCECIWFEAGLWARLWNRLWYKKGDGIARKCLFFVMVAVFAPILLILLPTVWWRKSKRADNR
jgi:hypothetical protein